jgi:hypothetical protein
MEVKVLETDKKYELRPGGQSLADNSAWAEVVGAGVDKVYVDTADQALSVQLASITNRYASLINATGTTYYSSTNAVFAAAKAGDTVNLYSPYLAPAVGGNLAFLDLKDSVGLNVYGVQLTSPGANQDIMTFRGKNIVVNGFGSTLSQLQGTAGTGGWFAGVYPGQEVDVTVNNLNMYLQGSYSVGFALFGNGTVRYKGDVQSAGRYVVRLRPNTGTMNFQGQGIIRQNGVSNLFQLESMGGTPTLTWDGDIYAYNASNIYMSAGTLTLRNGILHAQQRDTGAEQVFVQYPGAITTVVLENYTILGTPGKTVLQASTIVLRGNSVVVGNMVGTIVDERQLSTALDITKAYVDAADQALQTQVTANASAIAAERGRMDTLVADAPQALDTLKEIADQLAADEHGTAAILATQQQHTQQLANLPAVPTTTDALPEGNTNKYYTDARAQSAVTDQLAGKVDKVNGLQLSQESYTTAEKSKLAFNPYAVPTDVRIALTSNTAKWKDAELVTATSQLYAQPYPSSSAPGMKFMRSNGTTSYVYEYMVSSYDTGSFTLYNWVRYVAG